MYRAPITGQALETQNELYSHIRSDRGVCSEEQSSVPCVIVKEEAISVF